MLEAAVILDFDGHPVFWHQPPGTTGYAIADSKRFRDVIEEVERRPGRVGAIAHLHPWAGPALASDVDKSTFSAIDIMLGRRLTWWIATMDALAVVGFVGPKPYDYADMRLMTVEPVWVDRLRRLGEGYGQPQPRDGQRPGA